ncbi:hypothetical protein [Holospora curviuscula]|nr:hypothetical protein [Holospora curviuscula]
MKTKLLEADQSDLKNQAWKIREEGINKRKEKHERRRPKDARLV